jgi:protein-S-isoprenylcysteine O-methyltransferase Ste14
LNGWLLLVIFFGIFGLIVLTSPKEVIARLYEDEEWKKRGILLRITGLIGVLIFFILFILTPLKIGSIEFLIGIIIFSIGTVGMAIALLNFKNAPLGKPITSGLYRISRNPQMLTIYIAFLGICLAIGSGIELIILSISIIGGHFRILSEERKLLEQYGESYEAYKKKIPRYFLFF